MCCTGSISHLKRDDQSEQEAGHLAQKLKGYPLFTAKVLVRAFENTPLGLLGEEIWP